jgi:hypothetical protein
MRIVTQKIDIVGMVFGKWTVIGESDSGDAKKVRCQCECGNIKDVFKNNLKRGASNSCGCDKRIDLAGQKVGRLTIKYPIHKFTKTGTKVLYWVCICDCGKLTEVTSSSLHSKSILSCGCYQYEYKRKKKLAHEYGNTRIYRSFMHMHRRCENPKSARYDDYGGRGIKVCDEWTNFEPFLEWAMSNGYTDDLTIDRIDVDGPYAPWNCRWADISTQANNRQNTIYIEFNGKKQTISAWAKELGINRKIIYKRHWLGWSPEKILSPENFKGRCKPSHKGGD